MDSLRRLNGVLPLFKPAGMTSAECLDAFKQRLIQTASTKGDKAISLRKFAKICKVGHGGTLDPMATGVLVVGLNAGCKQLGAALSGHKTYRFEARLGAHFDTYDCTGKEVEQKQVPLLHVAQIQAAANNFVGPAIMQRPPAFSAVHVDGKRAHELARQGAAVEIAAKPVRIDRLHILSYDPHTHRLTAEMDCGGGTYVRSLIVDLAIALGTVGHMTCLERIVQSPFSIDDCMRLEDCADLAKVQKALKATL